MDNLSGLIGTKIDQTQGFLQDGTRVPLTRIMVSGNWITQVKSPETDHYSAVQLGFGTKKKATKAIKNHTKKAGRDTAPRFFREVRVSDTSGFEIGQDIKAEDLLKPGDFINVTGKSKGKGYAGVVKRHGFRGGPRTHGQSDRERAPGSIGQTTTPGRVYKGKRMAGRMGNETVTLKNLTVMDVIDGILFVKGLIPGPRGAMVVVKKIGENKKYIPLFVKKTEETAVPDEQLASTPAVVEVVEEIKEETEIKEPESTNIEEKVEVKEAQEVEKPKERTEESEVKEEENAGK